MKPLLGEMFSMNSTKNSSVVGFGYILTNLPEILFSIPTITEILRHPWAPEPQLFDGIAQTSPDESLTVTEIEDVPWPEFIVHPVGTVQLYDVAFEADAEYTCELFCPGVELPVTDACPGNSVTVTYKFPAVPLPQEFDGVVETFPGELPTVTEIEEVPWPEFIVHPDGTVQHSRLTLNRFVSCFDRRLNFR